MPLALKHAASAGLTKTSKPIKPSRATSAQLDRTGTGVLDARSVQTRAASLDAALLRHASTEALPNTAEDLFAPILRSSKNLPEWAQRYMNLLAESTTTQGSMQTHLVKMLAKGAADLNKTAQIVTDPMDGVTDLLADQTSKLILHNMDRIAQWRSGGMASFRLVAEPAPQSDDAQHEGAADQQQPAAGPGPASELPDMALETDVNVKSDSAASWKRLRMAVKSTAMFRTQQRAKDDTCLPDSNSGINPVHSKALSLLLSMMMSGATSGVSAAMPADFHLPSFSSAPTMEVSATQQVQASPEVRAFRAAASFARAPSLAASFRAADCSDSVIGISGMAASTAMKLLRSDSKSSQGVSQIFGAILETVSEAEERDRRARGSG